MKKTEGPFGKRGVEEKCSSVGTAPGISAEGEAIVDHEDDWVGGRGQAAMVGQLGFVVRGMRNRTMTVTVTAHIPHTARHYRNVGIALFITLSSIAYFLSAHPPIPCESAFAGAHSIIAPNKAFTTS